MKISAIKNYQSVPNFNANDIGKNGYENPINRKTEKNLAILSGTAGSLVTGGIGYGISAYVMKNMNKAPKQLQGIAIGIGAAIAALTFGLTMPNKLYNTKVNAFVREKETDAFSVKKDTQANLYDGVNQQANDPEKLNDAVGNFAKMNMSDKGKGMMFMS